MLRRRFSSRSGFAMNGSGFSSSDLHNATFAATSRSASQKFIIIFGMIIMVFGSVGNILTMVVIAMYKSMRLSSRSLFFLLAFSDEMALLLAQIRYWILAFREVDIRDRNSATCKMHTFFTYTFINLSTLLLCLISLERMCLTYFPLKKHPFNKMRHVVIIILTTAVINCVKNSFYLSQKLNNGECSLVTSKNHVATEVVDLMSYLFPFFVMLVATLMTLWKVSHQKNQILSTDCHCSPNARLRSTTMMLVGVVVVQLICGLPGHLFTVLYNARVLNNVPEEVGVSLLTLMIANNAANFYVYLISARGFRKTFCNICYAITNAIIALFS